ncbi:MAG: hypothetical protein AAFV95_13055 [Bacteroidota bacterium]
MKWITARLFLFLLLLLGWTACQRKAIPQHYERQREMMTKIDSTDVFSTWAFTERCDDSE